MLPFPISNFNWNWQHGHWQHFHIGNILKVILIYIPVRSAGGELGDRMLQMYGAGGGRRPVPRFLGHGLPLQIVDLFALDFGLDFARLFVRRLPGVFEQLATGAVVEAADAFPETRVHDEEQFRGGADTTKSSSAAVPTNAE